jgi:hypothetical protein
MRPIEDHAPNNERQRDQGKQETWPPGKQHQQNSIHQIEVERGDHWLSLRGVAIRAIIEECGPIVNSFVYPKLRHY